MMVKVHCSLGLNTHTQTMDLDWHEEASQSTGGVSNAAAAFCNRTDYLIAFNDSSQINICVSETLSDCARIAAELP